MKKILVPTDFSANSKAGMRFAIQWAAAQKGELLFVHVLHILRMSSWSQVHYERYAAEERAAHLKKLRSFVDGVYTSLGVKPGKHSIELLEGVSADNCIMEYCLKHNNVDCICISTRGAGKLKRIFGTNTGNLITKSSVPVLAVPAGYRSKPVQSVLYASDFKNLSAELEHVAAFAAPFKAPVEVLHFTWPDEALMDRQTVQQAVKGKYKYGLKLVYEQTDVVQTLVERLQHQVRLRKPAVVVMFTNQERTFFQKLFLSSKTEEFSFNLKVPLLSFPKS